MITVFPIDIKNIELNLILFIKTFVKHEYVYRHLMNIFVYVCVCISSNKLSLKTLESLLFKSKIRFFK